MNLPHETALKLKEAGFPQIGHGSFGTIKPGCEDNMRVLVGELPVGEKVYIPTLSELIEACGKELNMLVNLPDMNAWDAVHNLGRSMRGTTPTEAVANLYIALNSK